MLVFVTNSSQPLANNIRDAATGTIVAGPTMIFIDNQPDALAIAARPGLNSTCTSSGTPNATTSFAAPTTVTLTPAAQSTVVSATVTSIVTSASQTMASTTVSNSWTAVTTTISPSEASSILASAVTSMSL